MPFLIWSLQNYNYSSKAPTSASSHFLLSILNVTVLSLALQYVSYYTTITTNTTAIPFAVQHR